jgi:hypothetical protein
MDTSGAPVVTVPAGDALFVRKDAYMKTLILTLAAALTLGGAVAATPAVAQGQRTVVRTTTTTTAPRVQERTVVRTHRTIVRHRSMSVHRDWNRGRHYGWNRGHHRGWASSHRTCRTVWRMHQRVRTCRSW